MNGTNIQRFMDHLTRDLVPGNAIQVWQHGRPVFSYASGYSDLENRIPMTGEERLFIYSCSKVLTVTAAMQLLERGVYLLDDPLYVFLPEFKDMMVRDGDSLRPAKTPITLRHLFTMTAGLNYNRNCEWDHKAMELTGGRMDTRTAIRCLAEVPLDFEPGTRWQYSLCHDVLACVVEVASGKKFRNYVQENIFDPVDMPHSGYVVNDEVLSQMAQQYTYRTGSTPADIVSAQISGSLTKDGVIQNVGKTNSLLFGPEYDSGGAGIITTVGDYARFASTLARGGITPYGDRIIGAGTIALMQQDQLNDTTRPYFNWSALRGYGYGLGVRTLVSKSLGSSCGSLGEFGWGGAAGATILVDPDREMAFFYAHHMLNPQEDYYQPRLRNVVYSCLD